MVSRYHWLTQSVDTFPLANSSLITVFDKTYTIPAGGILKKFLMHNVQFGGLTHGNAYTEVPLWCMEHVVTILNGPAVNRIIYKSGRKIPFNVSFYTESFINVYATYLTAGDLELGFDQKCSYGKESDTAAWQVRVLSFMQEMLGRTKNWDTFGSHYTAQCDLLYWK